MANFQQSERTLKIKENFIELHNQGLDIKEIAERFNLNLTTIYHSLNEIAEKAGVSRESLLQRPHGPHLGYKRRDYQALATLNSDEYQAHIKSTLAEFDQTIATVDQYISIQQNIQPQEGEEC